MFLFSTYNPLSSRVSNSKIKPYVFTHIIIISGALHFRVYFLCYVLIHLKAMISCSFVIMQEEKPSLYLSILRGRSLPLCNFCEQ